MDESKPDNKMRFSTKAGLTLGAAFIGIPQLMQVKDFFMGEQRVTNERIETTMKESFARLENKLDKHIDDETVKHMRIRDLGREELGQAEARCEKNSDKIEARVSNLEAYILNKHAVRKSPAEGG